MHIYIILYLYNEMVSDSTYCPDVFELFSIYLIWQFDLNCSWNWARETVALSKFSAF